MGKGNGKNNGRSEGAKGRREENKANKAQKEKGRWKDVLADVTYTSGPGDNIYVFG